MFHVMVFHVAFQRKRFRGLRPIGGPDSAEEVNAKRRQLEKDARVYLCRFSDIELLHVREFFEFQSSVWYWLIHMLASFHVSAVYHVGPRELIQLYIKAHESPDLLAMNVCVVPPTHWDFEGVPFGEAFYQATLLRSIKPVNSATGLIPSPSTILDDLVPMPFGCNFLLFNQSSQHLCSDSLNDTS